MESFEIHQQQPKSDPQNPEAAKEAERKIAREKLDQLYYLPDFEEIHKGFKQLDRSESGNWMMHDDFDKYCKENNLFEIFNKEYIRLLANYLKERIEQYGATPEKPITILEVGAGNGRLTHFLDKAVRKLEIADLVSMKAIDNGKWEIKPMVNVRKMETEEALERYQPTIVVSSWMFGNWTDKIAQCQSVKEYILIGEPQICAGEEAYDPETVREDLGFRTKELKKLHKYQVCKTDANVSGHSETHAFYRIQNNKKIKPPA